MGRDLEKHEIEAAACAAHEVNRAWNGTISSVMDPHWDELPEAAKKSARLGVIGVVSLDFNAEQSHAAWVAEKKSDGWTVGEKKNLELKEHNCLVPFSELEIQQQAKDELWVDTVRSFIKHFWRIPTQ